MFNTENVHWISYKINFIWIIRIIIKVLYLLIWICFEINFILLMKYNHVIMMDALDSI